MCKCKCAYICVCELVCMCICVHQNSLNIKSPQVRTTDCTPSLSRCFPVLKPIFISKLMVIIIAFSYRYLFLFHAWLLRWKLLILYKGTGRDNLTLLLNLAEKRNFFTTECNVGYGLSHPALLWAFFSLSLTCCGFSHVVFIIFESFLLFFGVFNVLLW